MEITLFRWPPQADSKLGCDSLNTCFATGTHVVAKEETFGEENDSVATPPTWTFEPLSDLLFPEVANSGYKAGLIWAKPFNSKRIE